jgi:hypothetical protein
MFCNYVITQIYSRPEGIPIFGVNFFGLTAQLTDHLMPPWGGLGGRGEAGGGGVGWCENSLYHHPDPIHHPEITHAYLSHQCEP